MHLAIGTVLQQVFTFKQPPKIQVRNTAIILGILVPFVVYHCVADEFILHVILFFCMSWIVAGKVRLLIREQVQDAGEHCSPGALIYPIPSKSTDNVMIPGHRAKLRSLVTFATCNALFAYFLWNIDVHCCAMITKWKHQLGMPWGILLELHGYWHILTSISAYTFMAIIEFLVSEDDRSRGIGFAWFVNNASATDRRSVVMKIPLTVLLFQAGTCCHEGSGTFRDEKQNGDERCG